MTKIQGAGKKSKKRKVNLVFDDEKRRDFLKGFHKRKLMRKKKAKEDLEQQLKDERKRLKQEARDSYKKLVVSHRPIPELEKLLEDEYETEDVSVKVVELSVENIAKSNNWIGSNVPQYEEEEIESEAEENQVEELPGMELQKPKVQKETIEDSKQPFGTKKDIKRELRKKATKNVQKSKPFQMKNKLERQKNKKIASKKKNQKLKINTKRAKHKGKRITIE